MNQRKLIKKIQKTAEIIAKKSRVDPANWIILSVEATKMFEKYKTQQERKEKLSKIKNSQK